MSDRMVMRTLTFTSPSDTSPSELFSQSRAQLDTPEEDLSTPPHIITQHRRRLTHPSSTSPSSLKFSSRIVPSNRLNRMTFNESTSNESTSPTKKRELQQKVRAIDSFNSPFSPSFPNLRRLEFSTSSPTIPDPNAFSPESVSSTTSFRYPDEANLTSPKSTPPALFGNPKQITPATPCARKTKSRLNNGSLQLTNDSQENSENRRIMDCFRKSSGFQFPQGSSLANLKLSSQKQLGAGDFMIVYQIFPENPEAEVYEKKLSEMVVKVVNTGITSHIKHYSEKGLVISLRKCQEIYASLMKIKGFPIAIVYNNATMMEDGYQLMEKLSPLGYSVNDVNVTYENLPSEMQQLLKKARFCFETTLKHRLALDLKPDNFLIRESTQQAVLADTIMFDTDFDKAKLVNTLKQWAKVKDTETYNPSILNYFLEGISDKFFINLVKLEIESRRQ